MALYTIENYIFDSNSLLLYDATINRENLEGLVQSPEIDEIYNDAHITLSKLNSEDMEMSKIAINMLGIIPTYNCNLRCSYCGYSSKENDKNKLDINQVKLFVSDIIKKRTIKKLIYRTNEPLQVTITGGGEPTYDWELLQQTMEFLKNECAINNIPLFCQITTNGVLGEEKVEFLSKHFQHVMVSYDGLPDVQDNNRRSKYGDKTSNMVENSIRQFVKNNVPLTIRSTIWQKDYDKLSEMYQHIFSLIPYESDAKWSIYPTLYEGRAVNRINEQEPNPYKNFMSNYVKLCKDIIKEKGFCGLRKIEVPLFSNETYGIYCGAHMINHPWLIPDGSITTCIESKNNQTKIGEVGSNGIVYYKKYRDPLLEITKQKQDECRDCIAYHFCRGGCPIWHLRTENIRNEPLECGLIKEYWLYVIRSAVKGEYCFGWELKKLNTNCNDKQIFRLFKNKEN